MSLYVYERERKFKQFLSFLYRTFYGNNGLAIEFADERLKRNVRIIKWAMKENPQAIWKADEFIHDHPDLR